MSGNGEGEQAAPFWSDRLAHAVGAQHVMAERGRALVRPGAPAELVDVLRIAGEVGACVGVGPGVGNHEGIDVDLSRMCNVLHLDETSLLVTAQAGITVDALERALRERGLVLTGLPPWSRARTLGGLLAAPHPAEASPLIGRFTQSCVGIQALLPDGSEIATRLAPRKATGPDLMQVVLGARGTLGLITAATLRVQRRQEARRSVSLKLPSLPAALSAARAILVRGGRPYDLQVSAAGVVTVSVEGPEPLVAAELTLAERTARELDGETVPSLPPPRQTSRPHERAVPLESVDTAVLASALVGDAVRVVGWHTGGACVIDSARPAAPPPPPPPFYRALKQRLDPHGRFIAWPEATH